MRDSLVFYASFNEAIEALPEEEQLKAYKAVLNYALKGILPNKEIGVAYAIFLAVKPQIDANNQRYENSSKGGRPKNKKPMVSDNEEIEKPMVLENDENAKPMVSELSENEKPMVSENSQIQKPNVNENVNVNVNVNENDKEKEIKKEKAVRFLPPSLDEVAAYCRERSNGIDPKQFIDFYQSKGWMVGSNKMKDWQAAVRTWEKRERKTLKPPKEIPDYSEAVTDISLSISDDEYRQLIESKS